MSNYPTYNPLIICNILNHGNTYDEWSTSFIIALSKIEEVQSVKIIAPLSNGGSEISLPKKCQLNSILDYKNPFSILSIIPEIINSNNDTIIIVSGPTAFGNNALSNIFGMILPFVLKIFTKKTVKIINQGSAFTHNVKALGYSGWINTLKLKFSMVLEKIVYKKVKTYFQLNYYCELIGKKLGRGHVGGLLISDYIDAIATLYINGMDEKKTIPRQIQHDNIKILLHGFWGPQKNPEIALKAIQVMKKKYPNILVTVSGGINSHFVNYNEYFLSLLDSYKECIERYLGYVQEKELFNLFIEHQIVLMPYIASGGQSGVLETASFFENIVVCTDLPEFREEKKSDLIILTSLDDFERATEKAINMVEIIPKEIEVSNKINIVIENLKKFIQD